MLTCKWPFKILIVKKLIKSHLLSNPWQSTHAENDEVDDGLGDISLQDSGDEKLSSNTDQCPVCLMSLKEQLLGTPNNCPHVFCFECIQEWAKVRHTQWLLWYNAGS